MWSNGGLEVSEAKRLKGLEGENAKLKEPLADAMLDNAALKGSDKKSAAKREAVAHLRCAFDMSERRACRVVGCARESKNRITDQRILFFSPM